MAPFWETGRIVHVVVGSRAHGLATPGSDTDTRAVYIPPPEVLLGLATFEQHTSEDGDHVTFALARFVRLALAGNPAAIELLYTHPDDVLLVTDLGRQLLESRELFLTRQAGKRFVGYARHQLDRIERRRRNPTTTRNPARAVLESRHGYDTKHAMHACRLLRTGVEILSTGEVHVRRPDALWLRSIREGALSYDELRRWVQGQLDAVPDLVAGSPLPAEPDEGAADRLVIEAHRHALTRAWSTP
jgi:uncharacterized protein